MQLDAIFHALRFITEQSLVELLDAILSCLELEMVCVSSPSLIGSSS